MSQPKPSVGRIVHVPMDPKVNNGADIAPAVITRVWSDDMVNVRVLTDGEHTPWRTSVSRVDELEADQHKVNGHVWCWPPRV